ncbi:MAG TPA: LytR C-terminal domain-containing protein [Jatrophihabitans sp.]|nr:LytR C-terminal domain-containing protein [Jatrophihabitans sp.]
MLGVIVLAVAIFALQNPKGSHSAANAAASGSPTPKSSTSAGPSAPGTGSASDTGSGAPSGSAASSSVETIPVSGSPSTISLAEAQQVPLVVLNNTTITGLAAQAEKRFQDAGWTVSGIGNLQNNILSTCAYYDPSDPSARPAAKALKEEFPTIKRVRRKFPELPPGPIVVVLTPDYSPQ